MIILVIGIIAIGLIKKQPRRYWYYGAAAVLWLFVVSLLLSGGGTLEDQRGDGLLMVPIRRALGDGSGMGIVAFVVVLLAWVPAIGLLRRGYVRPKPLSVLPKNP
jgi:hypothetical protein